MPRVKGPLMSMKASGTIAKSVNYRQTKRGTVARVHSIPTGDPTVAQLAIRAINKQVSQAWASVTPTDRLTWDSLADANFYSPFNAFFVVNFQRVLTGQSITDVWPPDEAPEEPKTVVTNLDPPSDPDVTGDYVESGTYGGKPYYQRTSPSELYNWYLGGVWFISPALGQESPGNFQLESEEVEGEYYGVGTYEGWVSVTLVE